MARRAFWSPAAPIGEFRQGARLVIALPRRARVRWSIDEGTRETETDTVETGLGTHAAELDTASLAAGDHVRFGWQWRDQPAPEAGGARVRVAAAAREGDR
jgi:glucoamylase